MLTDSHAHLEVIEDLEGSLERAKTAGVSKIITIGTDLESSKTAIKIAEEFSTKELEIYATCGIHPQDGKHDIDKIGLAKTMEAIRSLARTSKRVVGIGEAGLDYYLVASDQGPVTSKEEKEYQSELFKAQVELASDLDLPLVVHCRNAWGDVFEILRTAGNDKGVFHSFTGGVDEIEKAAELGFYVSFSGIVTFKNAKTTQEAAKKCSVDKILIETDSPFLSPEPLRGKKNESGNVRITAELLSNLRKIPGDVFFRQTSQNAQNLFKFDRISTL